MQVYERGAPMAAHDSSGKCIVMSWCQPMRAAPGYCRSPTCCRLAFKAATMTCPAQVAFNMFIPCMLFTKVASTLAAQPHISLLAIPAVAVMQASMTKWGAVG